MPQSQKDISIKDADRTSGAGAAEVMGQKCGRGEVED